MRATAAGNRALLYREQHDIIQRDYQRIATHHGPEGAAFTWVLTDRAQNPIPGGQSYLHDYHHDLHVDVPVPLVPFAHVPVPTPIHVPTGNVAVFNDRWRWIEQDMLPHYQQLLHRPAQMQALVNYPVADRARRWRQLPLPYPP